MSAHGKLFEVEAPAPLRKFEGEWLRHESNKQADEIYAASGDVRRILTKSDAKRYEKALDKLRRLMASIKSMLDEYEHLKSEWDELKAQSYRLKKELEEAAPDNVKRIKSQLAIIHDNARSIREDRRALDEKLRPHRKYILMERRIAGRLAEHEAALKDEVINAENRARMHTEANTIAEAVVETLNGLDFCFRTTITRNGKVRERVVSVGFQRVAVTPDTVQLKINAGSRGLFGGFKRHIPHSVNIIKAMRDTNVLDQVASVIEMPVSCPQLESGNWHEGTWVHVQRNGLRDGIREHVSYSDYIQRYPNDRRGMLPIPSGLKEGQWVGWAELAKQPHAIVTGQTGSGKTNAMLSIISTLISQHSPEDIQLVLADLKEGVDMHMFGQTPHCIGMIEDIHTLARVVAKMEAIRAERMKEFKAAGLRNILDFNRQHPDYKMPHLLFVVDEFGALGARSYKEEATIVYDATAQIAMKGRAAGVHLLIGAQTPTKQHIPADIRDNVTLRYAGRQASVYASIAATGTGAAAGLPSIPGRFWLDEGSQSGAVQMPEITDEEVFECIRAAMGYEPVPMVDVGMDATPEADALPVRVVVKKEFTHEHFIDIAINELEGTINYTQIHQIAQHEFDVSRSQVKRIADRIKALDKVEFGGNWFAVVNSGAGRGAKCLELITTSPDEYMSIAGD